LTLTEFLITVSETYDKDAPMSSAAQTLLRRADTHLKDLVPGGIVIRGSGGKGRGTYTPWVGFFDPDETDTPEAGIYVVYLFSADLSFVTLSVMQGITQLSKQLGAAPARERLRNDAIAIQVAISPTSGWDTTMALASTGFRQLAYEAGNIAARRYAIHQLPDEPALRQDLSRSLELYQAAVLAKRLLLQSQPGEIASSSVIQETVGDGADPLIGFKPKSADDYVTHMIGRTLIRSRRHERLVNSYASWARDHGFEASTEHPVDLVLRRDKNTWLVEGNVLYVGNATDAVRAAIGQLLTYRYFLYEPTKATQLVALFAEPVGDAFVAFLEECGIASVWKDMNGWSGSKQARQSGLTDSVSGPTTSGEPS
jgi:MrcB-like, N-terminal domain